jgi:hypothetical protein
VARANVFSPSPVRPLDGRVGLDPKGLGEHVCWGSPGETRARNCQESESVADPGPAALGAAMLEARRRKGPGWKPGPHSFAAGAAVESAAAPSGESWN